MRPPEPRALPLPPGCAPAAARARARRRGLLLVSAVLLAVALGAVAFQWQARAAEVPSEPVRILRSAPSAGPDAPLAAAREALRGGEAGEALALYRAVLEQDPHRREALLGLAAAHVARGQDEAAAGLYARVLEQAPRDATALAGLFALRGAGPDGVEPARLALLLEEGTAAAHLHFVLGNHHARAGRWPQARRAYARALELTSLEADYAFNLAVSLDRLGQGQAALGYYRQAVALAERGPAHFDSAEALARIGALAQSEQRP